MDDIVTIASMARTAMARSDASALEHDEEVDSDEVRKVLLVLGVPRSAFSLVTCCLFSTFSM